MGSSLFSNKSIAFKSWVRLKTAYILKGEMSLVKNQSLKTLVAAYLHNYPELRDNDYRLIANIWKEEVNYNDMSAEDFLRAFSKGKLSHPESIRRIRQKLQEKDIYLRGKKYEERKTTKEATERDAIRNWAS